MKVDGKRVALSLAGVVFAIGTVWIHYEVKAKMVPSSGLSGGGSVERSGSLALGDPVSDFTATRLNGTTISLAQFKDREVVLLDFWATWCQPCIRSMPNLQDLHDEFDELGVEVLAVNVGEELEPIRDFIELRGYSFPVVTDPRAKISEQFGIVGIPLLLIVGKDGQLRHIEMGYPSEQPEVETRTQRLREVLLELTQESTSTSQGT